jgi:predicted ATPase/DNA-binding SARP family transcriptional activator
VRVRVLGPVGVIQGDAGTWRPLGSRSQRLILAVLAARAGETVSADVLVDALWNDPPRTADHTLRTYVSRLRAVLGDAVTITPGGYALVLGSDELDAARFESLTAEARRAADPAAAVRLFDGGLGLWSGPAFGELADVAVLRGAALRLEELRLAAVEARAGALLRSGDPAGAAAAAEELLAAHPLREGAWAVLVEALAAGGRARDSLGAYQRAAEALAEAGLVPSRQLREAEAAALGTSGPPVPVPEPRRIPVPASSLIGRDADLAHLDDLLTRARVVTLCGPGGVGKSRLAVAVADRVAARHRFGARLVALAPLDDPGALAGAVMDALGLSMEAGSPASALAQVGVLDLLVVLDNCEHLVEAAARAVESIVTGGGTARVLATSRERLGVDGEHLWAVSPLGLEGEGPAARALFIDRARAARPGLVVTEADLEAVDRITRRLDGLPLAIEMAAARVATLPLPELANRLEDLSELTSPRRGVEPRHRTLAAVVEWSEALLDEADRTFLAELSLFAGPVDVVDVAAVTGRSDPLPALSRLAERSLLVADTSGSRARFGMLDTIRAHAHRRLAASGRAAVLARRHAEHFTVAAEEADALLRGPDEATADARLKGLTDELRAAHHWARASDPALAGRLSAAVHLFAQSRLRDEPLAWAAELAADPTGGVSHPMVLTSTARRAYLAGELDAAHALAERALAAAAEAGPVARLFASDVLSDVLLFAGRLEESAAAAQRMLAEAEAAGDGHGVVMSHVNQAIAAAYGGRFDEAETVLGRLRNAGAVAPSDHAWVAYTEGEVVLDRDPSRALEALNRAVALADSVGNRFLGGVARVSACSLQARVGDPVEAQAAFAAVVEYWRRRGSRLQQLTTLRNLVVLLERVGRSGEAALLLGAVDAHSAAPAYGYEAARLDGLRRRMASALGTADAERRLAAGAQWTVDEAALAALGWLAQPAAATPG